MTGGSLTVEMLFVANSLGRGGAERTLADVAQRLQGKGYSARVLCLHGAGSLAEELAGKVPVEALGLPYSLRIGGLRRLRAAIKAHRPALVQCFHGTGNRWGTLAARLAGVRRVVQGLQNVFYSHGVRDTTLDRLSFSLAAHGVCCSASVHRFFIERKRYALRKLSVVPNGVDTARFDTSAYPPGLREEVGAAPADKLVGVVASLIPQKGHQYLLEAAPALLQRFPQTRFLFAGDGSLRGELEAQVRAKGLEDRIRFLGVRQDIPRLLASLDIFVLPSLWEGLPVALVEAMAAGLPVIASGVNGTAETVEHGTSGILVAPGDARALADALSRLLGDPDERCRLGKGARERAAAHFSIEATVEGYRRVYQRVLEGAA